MLDIALDELTTGRAQQVVAGQGWRNRGQGHAVLQLVTKPIRPTGLIKARPRPDPAGQGLIGEPAIEHNVHGPVGGLDLNLTKRVFPEPCDLGQFQVDIGLAILADQGLGLG